MAGFFFIGVPMSHRDLILACCFAAMFLSLCCAVAGVPVLVSVGYFVGSLAVAVWVANDPDFD